MGHSFKTSADQADRRLDRVLRGLYPGVPLGAIMKALRKGGVRVDGKKASLDRRLAEGEIVDVPWAAEEVRERNPASARQAGECENPATLFRSEDIWCLDKPAGLLSQPDSKGGDSLITRVWDELSWDRSDFRPAAINRLDRNVSGVIVVALNAPVLRALSSLMKDGGIGKKYMAIVHGSPPGEGEITLPLAKDRDRNFVRARCDGLASLTRYRVVRKYRGFSLVEIDLVTGRPHQARVHMAEIGYPIAGDAKYGKSEHSAGASRLFLHASSVIFPNSPDLPKELRCTIIESPLPKEFTSFLRRILE